MSASRTKFPKKVVPARQMHQSTTIIGKNGLPIDALATIEPGSTLVSPNNTTVSYASPTVTFDNSVDLSPLVNFTIQQAKHTGELLFTDDSGNSYFIDPDSVNNITKTLDIYIDANFTSSPSAIDTKKDWLLSEAELVNRLQTTTSAVIDQVEFRDVEVKFKLDGDPVSIIDSDGDELDVNPDGSINVVANASTTPSITNILMTLANTELSHIFPINTKKISLRVRGNSKLQYSFTAGQSGTQFITIYPGNEENISDVNLTSSLTIYFQPSKAGDTLEIVSWS